MAKSITPTFLTDALLTYWDFLDQGLFAEASQIKSSICIEQHRRCELGLAFKSRRFVTPAVTLDEMNLERLTAKKSLSLHLI